MITVKTILTAVAEEFGVSELEIISNRRAAKAMLPRHVTMYLARYMTFYSFPKIVLVLGRRDHTTVMYGVSRAAERMLASPELAARVGRLRDRIEQEAAQCA